MADSGTARRYKSQVITLADQLAIAAGDEVGQACGAAVLFKCLLYPVKELSGESRRLNIPYPCCSACSLGGSAATGRNLEWKRTANNSSSQRVGGGLKRNDETGLKIHKGKTEFMTICLFVCWLLNVPATCECISGTDLHRQFYVLPHWDRSCRSNFPSHPVTVYWHRADQSQCWPYNARRLAG